MICSFLKQPPPEFDYECHQLLDTVNTLFERGTVEEFTHDFIAHHKAPVFAIEDVTIDFDSCTIGYESSFCNVIGTLDREESGYAVILTDTAIICIALIVDDITVPYFTARYSDYYNAMFKDLVNDEDMHYEQH